MFKGLKKIHFKNIGNVKLSLSQIDERKCVLPLVGKSD